MTKEVDFITKNADDMIEEYTKYWEAEELGKTKGITVNKDISLISREKYN